MINYKFQINYKIKIKQKACEKFFFSYNSIATRVPLKDPYVLSSISHFTNYIKEVSPLAFSHKIHVPCRDEFIKA